MTEEFNEIIVEEVPAPEMTPEGLWSLRSAASWAKFIAIVNFISCGFLVLVSLTMLIAGFAGGDNPLFETYNSTFGPGFVYGLGIFYLALAMFGIALAINLWKFARHAKLAVDLGDSQFLETGMVGLKWYFKLSGIMIIVTFLMMILMIVTVVGAAM
jgi:hypothetical protein